MLSPHLAANPNETAIAISSSEAGFGPYSLSFSYGSGKAALNNVALSLKEHLEPHKIRIAAVSFGFVHTPLSSQLEAILPGYIKMEKIVPLYTTFFQATGPENSGVVYRLPQPTSRPSVWVGDDYEERSIVSSPHS